MFILLFKLNLHFFQINLKDDTPAIAIIAFTLYNNICYYIIVLLSAVTSKCPVAVIFHLQQTTLGQLSKCLQL